MVPDVAPRGVPEAGVPGKRRGGAIKRLGTGGAARKKRGEPVKEARALSPIIGAHPTDMETKQWT
jgi:hypothetical protein